MDWNEVRKGIQEPFPEVATSWVPAREKKERGRTMVAPYAERRGIE